MKEYQIVIETDARVDWITPPLNKEQEVIRRALDTTIKQAAHRLEPIIKRLLTQELERIGKELS